MKPYLIAIIVLVVLMVVAICAVIAWKFWPQKKKNPDYGDNDNIPDSEWNDDKTKFSRTENINGWKVNIVKNKKQEYFERSLDPSKFNNPINSLKKSEFLSQNSFKKIMDNIKIFGSSDDDKANEIISFISTQGRTPKDIIMNFYTHAGIENDKWHNHGYIYPEGSLIFIPINGNEIVEQFKLPNNKQVAKLVKQDGKVLVAGTNKINYSGFVFNLQNTISEQKNIDSGNNTIIINPKNNFKNAYTNLKHSDYQTSAVKPYTYKSKDKNIRCPNLEYKGGCVGIADNNGTLENIGKTNPDDQTRLLYNNEFTQLYDKDNAKIDIITTDGINLKEIDNHIYRTINNDTVTDKFNLFDNTADYLSFAIYKITSLL